MTAPLMHYKTITNHLSGNFLAAKSSFEENLRYLRPAEVFLVLAGLFGLAFIVLTPLMEVPDEVEHFYRAYQLSHLDIVSDRVGQAGYGGVLPASIVSTASQLKGQIPGHQSTKFSLRLLGRLDAVHLQPSRTQPVRFDNTAIYSPVSYIPQALTIGLGRLVHARPVWLAYAGRLANLVVWLALLYVAIKLTPVGKWALAAIALNPVSLFLAASLSADPMGVALCALYVAAILRLRLSQAPLVKIKLILFFVLVLAISLLKVGYLPLVFLTFLLPNQVLPRRYKIGIVACGLLFAVAWNVRILPMAQGIPQQLGIPGNISSSAQVHFIIGHPIEFIRVLVENALWTPSSTVTPSYFGLFGWADTWIPYWTQMLVAAGILLSLLYRPESDESLRLLTIKVRVWIGLVLLAAFLAVLALLYTGYSIVGGGIISGVQGRYFIPLSFLLVPLFASRNFKFTSKPRSFSLFMIIMISVALLTSLLTVWRRFY
jgi:uncharacterized membrane protein